MATAAKKTTSKARNWPKEPPVWDLSDLYPAIDHPQVAKDIKACKADSAKFRKAYEGKVGKLDGAALAKAIAEYEKLSDRLGRLGSYAGLSYAANSADPKVAQFYQNIQEADVAIGTNTLFFTLEINQIAEKDLQEKLKFKALAHYAPWLRDVRVYKPHQLSADLEQLLHEKSLSSRSAWNRLFDETEESLRFKIGGKKLNISQAMHLMSSSDEKERKEAAKEIGRVLGKNIRIFALITNTLAKDKEIEDKWRKFERPISSRNVANLVEDEVVDALLDTVRKNYHNLSHRYYAYKAKWMGKKKLNYWDRNAPLPGDDNRKYTWPEAVDIVLEAYEEFSPRFAEIGRTFFENDWIDVPPRAGKTSGAFSHPTVPSAHPYLLLNFQGKLDDIMTLAHELGHGVHQVLAAKQGALMADTPLTLAETASVFGEQIVFQKLLKAETDPARRKLLIADKVESMLNTVVRQVAFCEFERRVHSERREGELTADRIGEIWMDVQHESLGDAIKFKDEYKHYWSYIPHFIHTPFYVYAYAFGDCLVNSLYAVYKSGTVEDFEQKYITMLEAGGTLHHKDLLAPFGLDASKRDFWQKGLSVISGFIDELEKTA
jgi:oligoendopeptidase F